MGFPEGDYTVPESDPSRRELIIEKEGVNIGNISITVQFLRFDQLSAGDVVNITGVDPAEGYKMCLH